MTDAAAGLVALAAVLGVVVGERCGGGRGSAALLLAVVAAAGATRLRGRRRAAAGLLVVAALGGASMQRALDGLTGPLAGAARTGTDVRVAVTLTEDPRTLGPAAVWARVGIVGRIEGGLPHAAGKLVVVRASGATAGRLRLLTAGEGAVVSGWLRPLDGFDRRLRWRHVGAALDADDVTAVIPVRSPLMRTANRIRAVVLAGTARLPAPQSSLVAGFLVGDDRNLPARLRNDFQASGLSHLLVVSGANVALALAVAAPLLGRLGLTGRLVGGLTVIVVFAAVTRFEPSVLRASVMAALALLALFTGRPATGRRTLALAGAGLVLADPFLVHSVGFLLSCGASAGIVLLAPALAARAPGPRWVREPMAVTAAAQIGVAPVALPAFGGLPLIALPANLLVAPAAAALSLWGLGSSLAGAALDAAAPGLSGPLGVPSALLASYIAAVATSAARIPLQIGPSAALTLIALVAAVAVRSRRGGAAVRGRGPGRATSVPVPGS